LGELLRSDRESVVPAIIVFFLRFTTNHMSQLLDPRDGDIEDDWSSTKLRSLLSLAGSLAIEISLPKLAIALLLLIVTPALTLGLAPLLASAWVSKISAKVTSPVNRIWPAFVLFALLVVGLIGGRKLFRLAESSFWSVNSLVVEPGYVVCREGLRHIVEGVLGARATQAQLAVLRAGTAAIAGLVLCTVATLVFMLAWPTSRWLVTISDFTTWQRLVWVALANSVVVVTGYLAVASLVWAFADATMTPPRDLDSFCTSADGGRIWRIAHLSDIHVVGARYGFRIESGRSGPRGNDRLQAALSKLEILCSKRHLDAILITGDLTDAGRSTEWAEFLDLFRSHPQLAERVLILPGNHDVNIVDRSNPARLDTPTSPKKRLRKLRVLSAMYALQGQRVRVVDFEKRCLGETLAQTMETHLACMAEFADTGRPRVMTALTELWTRVFPMVLPPEDGHGLGIILVNSNANTHFSFTNALGMIPTEQLRGIEIVTAQYPQARWVIALHHHVVEYPRAANALSDRIGTALINGNWFLRRLHPLSSRAVLMHGHRHIDWIGECAGLLIVSAPSPVMEATDDHRTYFYIQSLAAGSDGQLKMLTPERIIVNDQSGAENFRRE
jgi:predicted MPP superfamily phosphohydrolase